jgi:hypothetical protein
MVDQLSGAGLDISSMMLKVTERIRKVDFSYFETQIPYFLDTVNCSLEVC